MMMRMLSGMLLMVFLTGCYVTKRLDDQVYINQRTKINQSPLRIDSLLIVTSGNSATQQISDDFISLFQNYLKERGVPSQRLFVSYSSQRIDEQRFNNGNYSYTLWIYEQDRKLQLLERSEYLVPLAMKLTDNRSSNNVWIATSIVNNLIRKKFYKEKYAGMLLLIFRANGFL